MTTAAFATSRPGVFERRGEPAADALASLKRAWRDHRAYRAALAQLRALSIEQREDLGIAGYEPEAVARAAIYGN